MTKFPSAGNGAGAAQRAKHIRHRPLRRDGRTSSARHLARAGWPVFDESCKLIKTLINGSALAAPWGWALAPASFRIFSNDLLIGTPSFLESEINAFDPTEVDPEIRTGG